MFPDWMLERFALGELDPENTRRVEAALAGSPELATRLEALREDGRRTLAQHPPELVARVVARRAAAAPARRSPWALALPALAGLAAVLAVVLFQPPPEDELRLKGSDAALRLFRLADAGPERLDEAAPVRAGDVVQVAFDLAGQSHLVVVSIDGAGNATLHFPLDGQSRAPDGLKALPQSFELDDAPAFERFFLVAGDQPLDATAVLERARRLARDPSARTGPLPAPPGATVSSLRLDKVTP